MDPLDPPFINLVHSADGKAEALREALLVFNKKAIMKKIGKNKSI